MKNFKIICFAIVGALLGAVAGFLGFFLFIWSFTLPIEWLLGIGLEIAWSLFLISPLIALIGFFIGAYYGAWVAVWTNGYSIREYARRIWYFLKNE